MLAQRHVTLSSLHSLLQYILTIFYNIDRNGDFQGMFLFQYTEIHTRLPILINFVFGNKLLGTLQSDNRALCAIVQWSGKYLLSAKHQQLNFNSCLKSLFYLPTDELSPTQFCHESIL